MRFDVMQYTKELAISILLKRGGFLQGILSVKTSCRTYKKCMHVSK